jgi:hypothetical protein
MRVLCLEKKGEKRSVPWVSSSGERHVGHDDPSRVRQLVPLKEEKKKNWKTKIKNKKTD